MTFRVTAVFTLEPDAVDEEIQRAERTGQLLVEVDGFLSYVVHRSGAHQTVVLQEWRDEASFKASVAKMRPAVGAASSGPPVVLDRDVYVGTVDVQVERAAS